MNIFLGILAVVTFLLVFNETDECKRKDFRWCFITTIVGMVVINLLKMII